MVGLLTPAFRAGGRDWDSATALIRYRSRF